MNSISEQLDKIRIVIGRLELSKMIAKYYTKSTKTDIGDIGILYEKYQQVCNPEYKDNTKLFILLAFYFYDPVSLVSKRMLRGNVRKEVGKVLGISASAVNKHITRSLAKIRKNLNAK